MMRSWSARGTWGAALLGYTRFVQCGLSIVAAFENDPAKVDTRIRDKAVLPIERLPELARRMHVHIGIITVPPEAAQRVADLMVEGGIRAIWNFAPVRLVLPPASFFTTKTCTARWPACHGSWQSC